MFDIKRSLQLIPPLYVHIDMSKPLASPPRAALLALAIAISACGEFSTEESIPVFEFKIELGPINGSLRGDWVGDRIVVGPGAGDGVETPYVYGYSEFVFDGERLALDRFVAVEGVEKMVSLESPRFTSAGEVWLRITTIGSGDIEYFYWDALCSPDGFNCAPVSAPADVARTAAVADNLSGGKE